MIAYIASLGDFERIITNKINEIYGILWGIMLSVYFLFKLFAFILFNA